MDNKRIDNTITSNEKAIAFPQFYGIVDSLGDGLLFLESDFERANITESAWQESIHIIDNEGFIKGKLKTAVI